MSSLHTDSPGLQPVRDEQKRAESISLKCLLATRRICRIRYNHSQLCRLVAKIPIHIHEILLNFILGGLN